MSAALLSLTLFWIGAPAEAEPQASAAVAKPSRPKTGPERGTFLFIRTKPDGAKVLIDGKQV